MSSESRMLRWAVILLSGCGLLSSDGKLPTRPLGAGDTVMVMGAARDLYPGVEITEEDLFAVELEPGYLPSGVFLSPEHVVGQKPRMRILANEFIRSDRLSNPEVSTGLSRIVPPGQRLVDLPATASTPPLRELVDVWWTPPDESSCVAADRVYVAQVGADRIQLIIKGPELAAVQRASRSPSLRYALRNENDDAPGGPRCSP